MDLYRIGTYGPAACFAELSPSEVKALVPYSSRIGFGTGMVNGTLVLIPLGLP